jgi:Zn-dependent metalloprotease
VFGSLVKQYHLGQAAADADWIIGAGLFARGVKGVGLRSMKAPGTAYDDPRIGKDPQPGDMMGYVETGDDSGGVHINSGIPNRAFFFSATGLGGYAWDKAGRVWYRASTAMLYPEADFKHFAEATVIAAGQMYGIGGNVQRIIFDAWSRVGLSLPASLLRSVGFGRRALLPEGSSTKE